MRVWDAQYSTYYGLKTLSWRRYLCAMWILCGELRSQYEDWLDNSERSLMASTLDLVRDVVISGVVTADAALVALELSARWDALLTERDNDPFVSPGQWNTWAVFSDLVAEAAGTRKRYAATERLGNAATMRWRVPTGKARHIDRNEEIDDATPMAQTLSRFQRVVTAIGLMPESEWDPAKVRAQILG